MSRSIAVGRAVFGALLLLAPASEPLPAQPTPGDTLTLSLTEALSIAVRSSPDLAARSWDPVAARGDAREAAAFPYNPELVFESRSPSAGFSARYEAEVGVQIEVAGQRGLRTRAAREGVLSADSRFRDVGRRLLAEVARAYHALVAAEQRAALFAAIEDTNERLATAVQRQRSEGEVSLLEANLVAVEAARARARALEQRSARTTASLELARLLGIDPRTEVRTAGPEAVPGRGTVPSSLDDAIRQALSGRPDLASRERDVEQARQEERLARRERLPNLRLAALATKEEPLIDPRFGVAIGLEIPLLNRNQGVTTRRAAELAASRAGLRATERTVRIEVEDAFRRHAAAGDEVALLESELLDPSRESLRLLDRAYQEGKVDLASLLLVRNQLLDAGLAYWDAWERRERARTDLRSATGDILEGFTFTPGTNP